MLNILKAKRFQECPVIQNKLMDCFGNLCVYIQFCQLDNIIMVRQMIISTSVYYMHGHLKVLNYSCKSVLKKPLQGSN